MKNTFTLIFLLCTIGFLNSLLVAELTNVDNKASGQDTEKQDKQANPPVNIHKIYPVNEVYGHIYKIFSMMDINQNGIIDKDYIGEGYRSDLDKGYLTIMKEQVGQNDGLTSKEIADYYYFYYRNFSVNEKAVAQTDQAIIKSLEKQGIRYYMHDYDGILYKEKNNIPDLYEHAIQFVKTEMSYPEKKEALIRAYRKLDIYFYVNGVKDNTENYLDESLKNKKADCQGVAIILYKMAEYARLNPRFHVIISRKRDVAHAFISISEFPDSERYIIDIADHWPRYQNTLALQTQNPIQVQAYFTSHDKITLALDEKERAKISLSLNPVSSFLLYSYFYYNYETLNEDEKIALLRYAITHNSSMTQPYEYLKSANPDVYKTLPPRAKPL